MPPHSSSAASAALMHAFGTQPEAFAFDSTFIHHHEDSTICLGDMKKAQLATPEWNLNSHLFSLDDSLTSFQTNASPILSHRLNVKTHVFKKELQEYIPTQIEDRLRIETIIYVELSIVDQATGAVVNSYDFVRLPKDLFLTQADKLMSAEELATKSVLNVQATLQCPSNGWQEEKEACLRCARRMSTKLDQSESRIMHMLPELHRAENGDSLISFRSGVANIQFKINCYCGHKKEKEGFVIRFDSQSDASIASHVTLPLMFYHQNKNKASTRTVTQSDQQQQQQVSSARNIVKSVTSITKRNPRPQKPGHSPIGHQLPSPPNSLLDSPNEWSSSPELDDFMDSSDIPFTVPSPPPPDPLISLFPDLTEESSSGTLEQQQPTVALISHMTPNTGSVRGGTLVTIHGTGFSVGEVLYVCFGENVVPIIPQHNHVMECVTPASNKADTVPVFAMNAVESGVAQTTFTYVDDNERELIKLALQRMMNITARMDGPLDSVMTRANEFAMWNDLLEGGLDGVSAASGENSFSSVEKMVLQTFTLLDSASTKNVEGLNMVNSTGHSMLHLAVAQEFQALARELIARGVDKSIQDKNGMTALDWAHTVGRNSAMVDILTGIEGEMSAVKDTDVTLSEDLLTKNGEVALGLQLSVNPGSGQDHDPSGHGQSDGPGGIGESKSMDNPTELALDLSDDPHMDIEWEGFGQGPGKSIAESDDVAGSKILEMNKMTGFLFDGASNFALQDLKNLPQGAATDLSSTSTTTVDKDTRMALLQRQYELRKTAILSAIPTLSGALADSLMEGSTSTLTSGAAAAAAQGCHSPAPQRRMFIPEQQAEVPGADVRMGKFEQNIPIQTSRFVDCPIGETLAPAARQSPVGNFDRTAPVGQEEVAQQGRTFGGEEWVPPSQGFTQPGERSSGGASAGIAIEVPGTGQQIFSYGHIEEFPRMEGLDVRVGQEMATEQAADQSSRYDVGSDHEEEEELYLGGLLVTASPRSARTFNAMQSLSRRSAGPLTNERGQVQPQQENDSQGSEEKVEERDQEADV
ncbi:hypothetical protein EMPS_10580 [Entomortierella parvispora]|uniref:IPT/TIG domain-containing protein n=1 Tax=Entomortierella parvispora TaxID=205924 RepID=A0A9P3M153_9FUNG|nr:hypothetical protein EMPS_10580 [Entomortierella parvispora]